MSQLVAVPSPASSREMIHRAMMLRRSFFPRARPPSRIACQIVYDAPVEIKRPRSLYVYSAPIGPQMPPANDLEAEVNAIETLVGRRIRVLDIIPAVTEHFGLSVKELLGVRRARRLVRARQVMMYLARELTTRSFPEIGRLIGRDHTTVLFGCRQIGKLLAAGDPIAADVEAIRARLLA